MRIASWNINSIRTRVDQVVAWGVEHGADVLLLQETKCGDDDFPYEPFTDAGYEVAHHGVNHWNGVAIASRRGLTDIERGFAGPAEPPFDEPRLMSAVIGGIRMWSIYVPNGRELNDPHYLYKLTWLERLRGDLLHRAAAAQPTIVAGDFNVAPTDLDIYMPSRWKRRTHASAPERAGIQAIVDLGLRDLTRDYLPEAGTYTWWSYRPGQYEKNQGLRIDLALCSNAVADRAENVWIDVAARGLERPTDHAPLVIDIPD